MWRARIAWLSVLVIGLLPAGCTDDPVRPADPVEVVIQGRMVSFGVEIPDADLRGGRVPGPFVVNGSNIHQDGESGAWLVDLSVVNGSAEPWFEPVELVFLSLNVHTLTILDADNGLTGPGARIAFRFAHDDGVWSPGESSLPRTVHFASSTGLPISFGGDIAIGRGPLSGAISGRVFHDADQNGSLDIGESGLPGVALALESTQPVGPAQEILRLSCMTTGDGDYVFGRLPVGTYTVRRTSAGLWPTTPETLTVALPPVDGGVGYAAGNDFGCLIELRLLLPAAADATVRTDLDSRRNDNYGANPFTLVGGSRGGGGLPLGSPDAIRSLVRFRFDDVIAPPWRAVLELTVANYQEGVNQNYRVAVHRVVDSGLLTPWIEGNGSEVTPLPVGTTSVDAAYGVAWVGAGDGGDANNQTQPGFAAEASASVDFAQGAQPPGSVVQWDVTALVNDWFAGAAPNHGLVLRDVTSDGTFRELWFGARDGLLRGFTDARVQPGPRLVLDIRY